MAQLVVVITGCSTGIGLSLATMLAKDKDKRYKVYATMRNLSKRGALDIGAADVLDKTLFVRQLDVTKDDSVDDFFRNLFQETGRIDVLVNNAGLGLCAVFECVPMETVRHVMETNFYGPLRTIRATLATMKKQRSGKIINVSSLYGVTGTPFKEVYSASKYAMEGMSECLVSSMRKFNVYVSTVQFGPVMTDVRKNMDLLLQDVDLSKTDAATIELTKVNERARQRMIAGIGQTADEAAEFIFSIILQEKPNFHYQSSEGVRNNMGMKFKDVTGEKLVNATVQNFLTD